MSASMKSRTRRAIVVATAAAAVIAPLTMAEGSAQAKGAPHLHILHTLSKGKFVGPLQFAVNGSKVYVADSFTSNLWQVGVGKPLATGPNPKKGGDIAGVAVNTDNGDIAYTSTDFVNHIAKLVVLHDGKPVMTAHIRKYEINNNPDKSQVYGVLDPAKYKCFAQTLEDNKIPVRYTGAIDAHPYAVAYLGDGAWAVADAGGNDVLRVSKYGNVTLIKTIGHQPLVVTPDFAASQHLDDCAIGKTYYTESVPTDVEVGPDGSLYVSTLPGGPEGPGVPSRGSVYEVDAAAHTATVLGTGFSDATNLAVTEGGAVYVAQPFAGRISVLSNGHPSVKMSFAGVAALEAANGHLYAATAPGLAGGSQPARVSELTY